MGLHHVMYHAVHKFARLSCVNVIHFQVNAESTEGSGRLQKGYTGCLKQEAQNSRGWLIRGKIFFVMT